GGLIDNVQFSPWRWHLFPHTHGAPPTGDEHQDHASNNALFHGRPSLVALLGCCLAGLLWIHTVARQSPDDCSRYYTAPEVAHQPQLGSLRSAVRSVRTALLGLREKRPGVLQLGPCSVAVCTERHDLVIIALRPGFLS